MRSFRFVHQYSHVAPQLACVAVNTAASVALAALQSHWTAQLIAMLSLFAMLAAFIWSVAYFTVKDPDKLRSETAFFRE